MNNIFNTPEITQLLRTPFSFYSATTTYVNPFYRPGDLDVNHFLSTVSTDFNPKTAKVKSMFEAFERYYCFSARATSGAKLQGIDFYNNETVIHASEVAVLDEKNNIDYSKTSIGCAAHVDLESAKINSLFELIESHCREKHWNDNNKIIKYNSLSFPDDVKLMLSFLSKKGYYTEVFNTSLFKGIYVIEVCIFSDDTNKPACIVGTAAHADPLVCFKKAFCEAFHLVIDFEQSQIADISIYIPDIPLTPEDHKLYFWNHEHLDSVKNKFLNIEECDFPEEISLSNSEVLYNVSLQISNKLSAEGDPPRWYITSPIEEKNFFVCRCVSKILVKKNYSATSTVIPSPW